MRSILLGLIVLAAGVGDRADELTIAKRMAPAGERSYPKRSVAELSQLLKRVRAAGVKRVRTPKLSPAGDRMVFVGEFNAVWRFVGIQIFRPRTDLWLINRDLTGLRRLTRNGYSDDPDWSPSGNKIAFAQSGGIRVIDLQTNEVRKIRGLRGSRRYTWEGDYQMYETPRWSPNERGILAFSGNSMGGGFVVVDARSGSRLTGTDNGDADFVSWDKKSRLILMGTPGTPPERIFFDWVAIANGRRPRIFLAERNGLYGFFSNERSMIEPRFNQIGRFSQGLAPVALHGKWGFIDTEGRMIIEPRFERASAFSKGAARVKLAGKWRLINRRGSLR